MMTPVPLAIAAVTLLAGIAGAAPTPVFTDSGFPAEVIASSSRSNDGIADFYQGDAQLVLPASAPHTTFHTRPNKPGSQQDLGDGSGDTKAVVVPLPAPAGLALAGLLLVGARRRR